jgi:hypothetical protein
LAGSFKVAKAKVMSRYVANVDKQEAKLFSELGHARRYAHTLPQGTMVVIVDLQARPVEPSTYVITAGEPGVVKTYPMAGKH